MADPTEKMKTLVQRFTAVRQEKISQGLLSQPQSTTAAPPVTLSIKCATFTPQWLYVIRDKDKKTMHRTSISGKKQFSFTPKSLALEAGLAYKFVAFKADPTQDKNTDRAATALSFDGKTTQIIVNLTYNEGNAQSKEEAPKDKEEARKEFLTAWRDYQQSLYNTVDMFYDRFNEADENVEINPWLACEIASKIAKADARVELALKIAEFMVSVGVQIAKSKEEKISIHDFNQKWKTAIESERQSCTHGNKRFEELWKQGKDGLEEVDSLRKQIPTFRKNLVTEWIKSSTDGYDWNSYAGVYVVNVSLIPPTSFLGSGPTTLADNAWYVSATIDDVSGQTGSRKALGDAYGEDTHLAQTPIDWVLNISIQNHSFQNDEVLQQAGIEVKNGSYFSAEYKNGAWTNSKGNATLFGVWKKSSSYKGLVIKSLTNE